eukprot:15980_1
MARMHPQYSQNNSKWPTPGTEVWQVGNTTHSPISCQTPYMQKPHGAYYSIAVTGGQLQRKYQHNHSTSTRTQLLYNTALFAPYKTQQPLSSLQNNQYSNNDEILVSECCLMVSSFPLAVRPPPRL